RHLVGVDAHVRAVGWIELPELHENRAAGCGSGRVLRLRRIADVAARREIAMLVLKDAFEDEEFLAAGMDVRREGTLRCIAHDRRRPGDLVTEAIEHAALDARHRRGLPRQPGGMDRGPFIEIGIELHARPPSLPAPSSATWQLCIRLAATTAGRMG